VCLRQVINCYLFSLYNEDGGVNFEDPKAIADQWLQPPSVPSADIVPLPEGDGMVNILDFAALAENWLVEGLY